MLMIIALSPSKLNKRTMTGNEQGDYTTTYIKSLQQPAKYPSAHYHRHLNDGALSNSSLEMLFAAQHNGQSAKLGSMDGNERIRLGVKLIQRRWMGDCTINKRSGLIDVEECSDDEGNENIVDNQEKRRKRPRVDSLSSTSSDKFNNSTATILPSTSIQPKLLFRRTSSHLSHSTARYYNDVHFLHSSSVVIGVDNYGDLDVVRVPSFSSGGLAGGRNNHNCFDDGASDDGASDDGSGGKGVGKLQAGRISIFSNNNNETNNNGPRQAMSQFHYELFGYDNGDKFAVGTRCGRVQLFATELATNGSVLECAHSNNKSRCRNTAVGSTNALWSSLPTTSTSIGPRRRYYKSDKCPLYTMLSNNHSDKNIFDAYNTSYLEEIPHWDNDYDNLLTSNTVQGSECPWAFRENGTSLLGACVDANNGDCFSLRVLDERCGLESSVMNVIVADCERNAASKATSKGSNSGEAVDSVCFSGQFGLVTSHRVWDNYLTPASSCLKCWDHRMLRSHRTINTMCLSFPRDSVSLVSPDVERFLSSSTNFPHHRSDPLPTLYELSADQHNWDDARFKVYNVKRLVGSRDLSDRIAIQSNVNGCKDEILMVDSCRGEVTQFIQLDKLANGVSPSISSYLETMACVTTENEGQEQVMCIYDVSRQRKDLSEIDLYLDTCTNNSGRKRHLLSGGMNNDDSMNNGDLLRMLSPKVHDMYGIDSSLTCLAIDECGDTIVCGTSDGDMFVLNSSDLGDLTESE